MSDSATFELRTKLDEKIIQEEISKIWIQPRGKGYYVDVFPGYKIDKNSKPKAVDTLICEVSYIFGSKDEDNSIREIIKYLLQISIDNRIYYYRCADFLGSVKDDWVVEITIEDLFTEKYRPSIGANVVEKYLIQGFVLSLM